MVSSSPELIDVARSLIEEQGMHALTIERLAAAAGTSRMTLHRRGIDRAWVVAALTDQAAEAYLNAAWPALTSSDAADVRLRQLFEAMLGVADDYLALLSGLFSSSDSPFHVDDGAEHETDLVFVQPIERILRDGELDGTLGPFDDPAEVAAVLFNSIGWGYVHLRHAQRWGAERARRSVLDLVERAVKA